MVEDKNKEVDLKAYETSGVEDFFHDLAYVIPVVNLVMMIVDLTTWSYDDANAKVRKNIAEQIINDKVKALW